jgi:hypothetical protein
VTPLAAAGQGQRGALLALLGSAAWLLATAPAINAASVLAFACLVVLVLAGAALALTRRG